MQGRICLITGANSGIGKATAMGLAGMGATIVMVCRDRTRGEAALAEIKRQTGNEQIDLLIADLSSQQAIRRLAEAIHQRYDRLHVLINNAGMSRSRRSVTIDGLETTFAVNHLAYFLLTNLLLDVLKDSVPARIVNVSSGAERSGRIDFDDLQAVRRYWAWGAYAQSKLANILFTYELARRLEGTGVTVNCMHPGTVATNIFNGGPWLFRLGVKLVRPFMLRPEQGADTVVYLASAPEVESVSGKYFIKRQAVASSPRSYDEAVQQHLWEASERLTGPAPRSAASPERPGQ